MAKKTGSGDRHKSKAVVRMPDDIHRLMAEVAREEDRPLTRVYREAAVAFLRSLGKWPAGGR